MPLSQTHQPPFPSPGTEARPATADTATVIGGHAPEAHQRCDECGAPVDSAQRYCVVCGTHRRHVNDPAARYLSQATARSRTARAAGAARRSPRSGRWRGLGTALVLAIIPVAAAAGVMVGRSSNNDDSKLIQALAKRQAAVVTTSSAGSSIARVGSTPNATAATSRTKTTHKGAGRGAASSTHTGQASSTTQYGSVSQIAGAKPTQAQVQQGAADTQKVQKSTGKSYVNQQSNLPGTVVVP